MDLRIEYEDENGQWILPEFGESTSNDNNYEVVDMLLPKSGNYRIKVYRTGNPTEDENAVGIAMILLDNVYIPIWDIP